MILKECNPIKIESETNMLMFISVNALLTPLPGPQHFTAYFFLTERKKERKKFFKKKKKEKEIEREKNLTKKRGKK